MGPKRHTTYNPKFGSVLASILLWIPGRNRNLDLSHVTDIKIVAFFAFNLGFPGGVIFFWGSVWALGALFMVALMAKNYCIKSAEAGSDY